MSPVALVVLCTAPADDRVCLALARGLVEAKLAACVNIVPGVRSVYSWQGSLNEDAEVQLLIKTRPELFDALERWLREHHPYEVPEIIALPVTTCSAPYLAWLNSQTQVE
jgi:periplasmic divalent cation tolerance protein